MMKRLFVIAFFVLAAALQGCSAHMMDLDDIARSDPGSTVFISGVPFFPQDEYMCGPAALASVFTYYGAGGGMQDAAKAVYNEKLKGTLPIDLFLYAKEKGFDTEFYKGSLGDLRDRLSKKEPVIIFLNLGYDFYPVGHYVVAVGMDERSGAVFAHSGLEKEKAFALGQFVDAWSKTGYSTLLVKPKGEWPKKPEPEKAEAEKTEPEKTQPERVQQ